MYVHIAYLVSGIDLSSNHLHEMRIFRYAYLFEFQQ